MTKNSGFKDTNNGETEISHEPVKTDDSGEQGAADGAPPLVSFIKSMWVLSCLLTVCKQATTNETCADKGAKKERAASQDHTSAATDLPLVRFEVNVCVLYCQLIVLQQTSTVTIAAGKGPKKKRNRATAETSAATDPPPLVSL